MRKHYSDVFKAQVVLELLKEEKTIAQISSETSVHPTQLKKWKATAISKLPNIFSDDRKTANKAAQDEKKINDLYAQIGRLTTQLTWLKKKSGIDTD
ncbi:MAG: Transposase [Pelotomaculum sp. PtaB.Bin104]|nr:MAG: Transposase [Pelotomaculum sp. PtaB.Bin104]